MNTKLKGLIDNQINIELESEYFYLSAVAYFGTRGLSGFSHWAQCQVGEERLHAIKFFNYVQDRGEKVTLDTIPKPEANFSSVLDLFEKSLRQEKQVTLKINELYNFANSINDTASTTFLHWYITEQVEEEKTISDIISKLKMIKEDTIGLLMLDKELGSRPIFNYNQSDPPT